MTVEDQEAGEDLKLSTLPRQFDGYTPPAPVLNTDHQLSHAAFLARVGAHVERPCEGRAYYSPARDLIVLPPFETFTDVHAY